MNAQKTALIVGADGFVGRFCLRYLCTEKAYTKVHALVRRPLGERHAKLVEHVIDFDALEKLRPFPAVTDVYCCLGTALSRLYDHRQLDLVDHHYPLAVARLALAVGARQFALVTSSGIGPRSPIYYCRVKSRAERDITALGFANVVIFRPSLLLGKRPQFRPFQEALSFVLKPLAWVFAGPLGRFRPVHGAAVGYAMVAMLQRKESGRHWVNSQQIDCLYREGVGRKRRERVPVKP